MEVERKISYHAIIGARAESTDVILVAWVFIRIIKTMDVVTPYQRVAMIIQSKGNPEQTDSIINFYRLSIATADRDS